MTSFGTCPTYEMMGVRFCAACDRAVGNAPGVFLARLLGFFIASLVLPVAVVVGLGAIVLVPIAFLSMNLLMLLLDVAILLLCKVVAGASLRALRFTLARGIHYCPHNDMLMHAPREPAVRLVAAAALAGAAWYAAQSGADSWIQASVSNDGGVVSLIYFLFLTGLSLLYSLKLVQLLREP